MKRLLNPHIQMRSLSALAWRQMKAQRVRTVLSTLAVALGGAIIVAADVIGAAIRSASQVLEGSQGTVAFAGDLINNGLRLMGLVVLIAAGFLILNAFTMAVTQRQRQIGTLRSLGMTSGQVLRLTLLEALWVGGAGTLLGVALGPLFGRGLLALMVTLVGIAHGPARATLSGLLQAAAAGWGITLLATLIPAWRAARIDPLAALRALPPPHGPESKSSLALWGSLLILLLGLYLLISPPGKQALTPPWDLVLTGLFALGWLTGLALAMPCLVGACSQALGRIQAGPSLRLSAGNLARDRGRVLLTMTTLIVGLMTIVSVTGISTFAFQVVTTQVIAQYDIDWVITPLPTPVDGSSVDWELLSKWDLSTAVLSPEFMQALDEVAAGQAHLVHLPQVAVPELAIMSGLPSFVADPEELRLSGLFTFIEGNWEKAEPIMESGCGLLLLPRMARKHNVGLYGTLTLPGSSGPVECTVAGLGTSSFMGTSIISRVAGPEFGLQPNQIFGIIVVPLPETDRTALHAAINNLPASYPNASIIEIDPFFEDVGQMVNSLQILLNGMLLLAILAAALGVANTTMISIQERRGELGLLRAVGATRQQVLAVITGEAAWMGLIGGILGLWAGVGLIAIFVAVNGGHMYGLEELSLWASAWAGIRPALANGLIGLAAAPLISAGAARIPARGLLRERVIAMTRAQS